MKAPISVCMITRDEPLTQKALESIRPYVEEIVLVDTGSEGVNGPPANGQKLVDVYSIYTGCNNPETGLIDSFSNARAHSFSLARQPWVMWMDADDEIANGEKLAALVEEGERLKKNGQAIGFLFPYEYAYDGAGRCVLRHYRERLFSNKEKFKWVNPCHEVCIPKEGEAAALIIRDEVIFKHKRQYSVKKTESGRNLRILRKYVAENGDADARILFYLGTECINSGAIDEGIRVLSQYMDVSGWDHEQFMACEKLTLTYLNRAMTTANDADKKKDLLEALRWSLKGVERREDWAEAYINLSKVYYFLAGIGWETQRSWEKCIYFGELGLTKPLTKTMLFINPLERECEIYKYLNIAYNSLGNVEKALECTRKGLEKDPTEPNMLFNGGLYEAFLVRRDALAAVGKLRDLGNRDQRFSKVNDASLATLQAIIQDQPLNVRHEYTLPPVYKRIEASNKARCSIVFACGDCWEPWNPDVIKQKGMGGSETAVAEMAKRLAAMGHSVSVYTSCGGPKVYDGVEYRESRDLKNTTCDVLVAWRNAEFLEPGEPWNIAAKTRVLWVHDVTAGNWTHGRGLRADRVFALSQWHKQYLMQQHNIPDGQMYVTRNGIDLARFDRGVPRNIHKVVCSSSPDRYLASLLRIWPKVRARIPDAELHLFYGFDNWKRMAESRKDMGQIQLISVMESQLELMTPLGVTMHGRVNPVGLALQFLSAGVWAFPTWWSETSCISAMEAQAAGLHMVTSPIAALNETAGDRARMISGDWMSAEYIEKFANNVVYCMENSYSPGRDSLQQYAKENFSWDGVAKDWDRLFKELLTAGPSMPAYTGAR